MRVARASRSASKLLCVGSRFCTNTYAIPVVAGSCFKRWVKASSPPAEAPIPTIGNEGIGVCSRVCVSRVSLSKGSVRSPLHDEVSVVLPTQCLNHMLYILCLGIAPRGIQIIPHNLRQTMEWDRLHHTR